MIVVANTAPGSVVENANSIMLTRVRITLVRGLAKLSHPAYRTATLVNIIARCIFGGRTFSSLFARNESAIANKEFIERPFAVDSNTIRSTEANLIAINNIAHTRVHARVRIASSGVFTCISIIVRSTFASERRILLFVAHSSVHASTSVSAISRQESKIGLVVSHQVNLASGSTESSRAETESLSVGTSRAFTLVHTWVVGTITNNRKVAVGTSPVRILTTTLVANSSYVYANTTVLANGTTITEEISQIHLTSFTKKVSRALA